MRMTSNGSALPALTRRLRQVLEATNGRDNDEIARVSVCSTRPSCTGTQSAAQGILSGASIISILGRNDDIDRRDRRHRDLTNRPGFVGDESSDGQTVSRSRCSVAVKIAKTFLFTGDSRWCPGAYGQMAPTSCMRLLRQGEDFCPVAGDSDGVLTVCCPAACRTSQRPPVGISDEFSGVGHDPRLQRQQQPGAQFVSTTGPSGVRNVRVLVHR